MHPDRFTADEQPIQQMIDLKSPTLISTHIARVTKGSLPSLLQLYQVATKRSPEASMILVQY